MTSNRGLLNKSKGLELLHYGDTTINSLCLLVNPSLIFSTSSFPLCSAERARQVVADITQPKCKHTLRFEVASPAVYKRYIILKIPIGCCVLLFMWSIIEGSEQKFQRSWDLNNAKETAEGKASILSQINSILI